MIIQKALSETLLLAALFALIFVNRSTLDFGHEVVQYIRCGCSMSVSDV